MNPSLYIAILLLWLVIYQQRQKKTVRRALRARRKRGNTPMNELIRRFMGKNCIVYSENGNAVQGIVEALEGNWVSVRTKTGSELINLDYINRIKEKPEKK